MEIFCDNEDLVDLTKEPKDHGRSRHIERKYHYIRHKVRLLMANPVSSKDNPIEPFTKVLSKINHVEHARRFRLRDDIRF